MPARAYDLGTCHLRPLFHPRVNVGGGVGPSPNGGSRRLAMTPEDVAGRQLLLDWVESLGCTWQRDRAGNLFIHRPGRENHLPAVAMGSHLDTQTLPQRLAHLEREAIREALELTGSTRKAAQELGVTQSWLMRRIKRYGIDTAGGEPQAK
ncbi:helix-turn-helix domain-containing protein [Halomonas sp. KAO]|uniref:helix-turn-helix domain-containing protein n=1 Tax=Halomonas sp. KAO TaxID=2783858 RepID=UPI001E45EED7|nr:helix-turn-helix domain-containing protein [Halomonas sp. KAO]